MGRVVSGTRHHIRHIIGAFYIRHESHVLDGQSWQHIHVICEVQSKGTSRHVLGSELKKKD